MHRNEWSTVTSPSYTRTSYTESRFNIHSQMYWQLNTIWLMFVDLVMSFCPQACWLPVGLPHIKNYYNCVHNTRKVWNWNVIMPEFDVMCSAHVKCLPLYYRTVSAKDICTYCHKNMYTDEKIVLDDMNINCHARCFKVSFFF